MTTGYSGNRQLKTMVSDDPEIVGSDGPSCANDPRHQTPEERTDHLSQVVENRRFLVLPWVQVQGLASTFLAGVARRLPVRPAGRSSCQ